MNIRSYLMFLLREKGRNQAIEKGRNQATCMQYCTVGERAVLQEGGGG